MRKYTGTVVKSISPDRGRQVQEQLQQEITRAREAVTRLEEDMNIIGAIESDNAEPETAVKQIKAVLKRSDGPAAAWAKANRKTLLDMLDHYSPPPAHEFSDALIDDAKEVVKRLRESSGSMYDTAPAGGYGRDLHESAASGYRFAASRLENLAEGKFDSARDFRVFVEQLIKNNLSTEPELKAFGERHREELEHSLAFVPSSSVAKWAKAQPEAGQGRGGAAAGR